MSLRIMQLLDELKQRISPTIDVRDFEIVTELQLLAGREFTGVPGFDQLLQKCFDILKVKGADYTIGNKDRLHNFRTVAEFTGLTMFQVLSVYWYKHVAAVFAYLKSGGQSESEPIEGRMADVINYMLLMKLMLDEGGKKSLQRRVEDFHARIGEHIKEHEAMSQSDDEHKQHVDAHFEQHFENIPSAVGTPMNPELEQSAPADVPVPYMPTKLAEVAGQAESSASSPLVVFDHGNIIIQHNGRRFVLVDDGIDQSVEETARRLSKIFGWELTICEDSKWQEVSKAAGAGGTFARHMSKQEMALLKEAVIKPTHIEPTTTTNKPCTRCGAVTLNNGNCPFACYVHPENAAPQVEPVRQGSTTSFKPNKKL